MEGQLGLVVLVIALVAAFIGGMIARQLRLPVILGYLAAGIVIGPYGASFVSESSTPQIEMMAEIGVALLLFTLGMEFSLKSLRKLGRVSIISGGIQIIATTLLGMSVGVGLGWKLEEAMFFGFMIAMSSTMVVLKLLIDRGELDTAHGRLMIGILLVQDVAIIPMMAIMPAIGKPEWASALGLAVLKAVIFIGAMFVLGLWVLPWLMRRVAGFRSRELFLLAIFGLCILVAFVTDHFGISLAFGAFAAGVIISGSDYAHQAIAEVIPLRDIFATLFFVSLGMLIDLHFFADNIAVVSIAVITIIVGKFAICFAAPRIAGYSAKTMMYSGAGLFQIGEFSFVLAAAALSAGVISSDIYNITLTSAAITILLTPLAMGGASRLYVLLNQRERFAAVFARRSDPEPERRMQLNNHVVICGCGRVGRILGSVLEKRGFTRLVIDDDPHVIDMVREKGVPYIYGDASNPDILARAGLDKAKVMVITMDDPIATELAVKNAQAINPKLDIVARVQFDEQADSLKEMGVAEIVRPDFEAGMEVVRHTLHRYGLNRAEIQYILNILREGGPEEQ
jgi:CPA2 family monovalent cation:H+ antiporter-2